ncbi:hypothetical protein Peur_024287 [Populus x canadensis]
MTILASDWFRELYPSNDDLLYEEEILRNSFSLKLWWRYLIARRESPFKKPARYSSQCSHTHPRFETLNNTFERALVSMHKMPRIWIIYLQSLIGLVTRTRTRRVFNRALCPLPVTQHDRIWELYLRFVSQDGFRIETSLRRYRRYLMLASVLNDDQFYSIEGKTKHSLWLELCDLTTRHAKEVLGLNVDAIIRGGIRKFMLSSKFEKKLLNGFWLDDDNDVDLMLADLEYLMDRRPGLASSTVLLRQNPHNLEQWQRRVKLFEGNPNKQILTYTEAIHNDLVANARVIFDKAVQVNYETVDNLAGVWCEWAEMEIRHQNFKGALELLSPLEAIYERIVDLRIATPQIIINYAWLLQEHKYFEDAFKVYERGVRIFKHPRVKDIWVTCLSKFVKRSSKAKLERARELSEHATEMVHEVLIHLHITCVTEIFLQFWFLVVTLILLPIALLMDYAFLLKILGL